VEDELFGYPDGSLSRQANYLLSSIRLANRVVYEKAVEYEQYHGMGTTIVALYVTPGHIVAANVGDSRIYMIRTGRIEKLSKDHTVVAEQIDMGTLTEEEAGASPLKHILTRNLGSANHVDVEIFEIQPSRNARFILCTDGLTDLVSEKEILEVARKADHPEKVCRRLVDMSLKRGAPDNTTVVAVFLEGAEEASAQPLKKLGLLLEKIIYSFQRVVRKIGG
jgi:protein phosphatase